MGGGHPLAGGDDEPGGVLLGGDHDQRAAVELASGLGAVDELPQPRDRGLRVAVVAVVVAQPSAGAVLARLGHVAAQLLDHQADAAGGDPRDALPGLGVRGAVVVGAEQGVDEEAGDVDVGRVDGRELVHERVPEVGVGAVRLIGELAQLRVALALGHGERVGRRRGGPLGLLVLGDRLRFGVQVVVGALDRGLDELAVERAVDDDRPSVLELDQHAGGARPVDVLVGEPHRRRAVGVAVELLVQLLGVRVELLGLLAQPQLVDLGRARGVQVGGEHLAVAGVRERGVEYPAGLARQPLGGPRVAVVEICDHGVEQLGRDGADRAQLVDRREVDDSLADQLLRALGELEQLDPGGDALLGPAERLGGAVLGQPAIEHRADGLGLLVGVELLARDVLHRAVGVLGLGVADDDRHLSQSQ